MSQFGGASKAPPPWQHQRPAQATPQIGSLLGQPPQPPHVVQQPQYAPVQQSMIQPPGLGGLQNLGQPNLGAASMAQPTMGAPQASNISMAAASIMGQPPVSSVTAAALQPPSLVNPSQLVNTVAPIQQQIQQQVSSVTYPAPRTMAQVTTVSYPAPRALAPQGFNPAATPSNLNPQGLAAPPGIPNVTNANIPGSNSTSGQQPQKQRVFTGTITKLCADFGFVDEDVFFQTSCVKGPKPSVNDRVLVEASYNPNMPFKWNANRVQVIPGPQNAPSANPPRTAPRDAREPQGRSGSYNAVPPPNFNSDAGGGALPPRSSTGNVRARSPRRDRRDRDRSRERDRSRNEKDRDEKRENRKRSRSRSRGRSPPRRRPRVLPRYNVQVPKIMLHMKEANVPELRKRYSNLYVPSDVFLARPLWSNTFQAHKPFHFPQPVSFHIMNKEVDPVLENDAIYDTPDANHNFAAKVMLMAVPAIQDIYRRACALSEDTSDVRDCFVHPTRLINFLVGLKGKNETMAIGGYWSPSQDGPNPEKDPQVLINTAIRTCRALTGIDLSSCTTWYRFAEIYYRRGGSSRSTNSSGSSGGTARVETTVLFLPDVWNVCPTKLEWDGLHLNYKRQLDKRLLAAGGATAAATSSDALAAAANILGANNLQISQPEQDEEEREEEEEMKKRDPTNWTELDPKTMKVVELRGELDARLMNSKGLKSQLIARLTKVLKTEQDKEEAEALANAELMKKDESRMKEEEDKKREEEKKRREEDENKKDEEEKKKAEERERTILEKRYTLPEQPMIVVHPSRTAKSGKFDCTTMSLSVLLDYRQEDNKEHSFEVSLFAELFNEMLMRDFAFRIYRSLVEAPEKKEEKKDSKDKEKDKKKDDKDDKDKDREREKDKDKEKDDRKERSKDDREEGSKKDKDDKDRIDEKDKKEVKDDKKSRDDSDDKKIKEDHKREDEEKKDEEEEDEEMEEEDDEEGDDEDSKDTRSSRGISKDKDKDKKPRSDDKKDRREKKDKKKMVTIDPYLLLAFVYFDQTHTGYIIDRDLEDIINMLGLNLSRAQQKKLMTKVISRDVLYYRKMTDIEEKEKEKPRESNPVTELDSLAMGNNGLLPTFMDQIMASMANQDKLLNKKDRTGLKEEVTVSATTMINYEGSIISIGKLMQQLERSQKARTDTEDKLRQLQKELEQSKEEAKNSTEKSHKLSREIRSANTNVKTLEEELQKVSEDNAVYQRALNGVRDVIKPLVTDLEYMDDTDVDMKPAVPAGTLEIKMEGDERPVENGTSQTK